MTFRVRHAGPEDAQELCRLLIEAARHHGHDEPPVTQGYVLSQLIDPAMNCITLVAVTSDNRTAGCCLAQPTQETGHASPGLYVSDLYVDPQWRRQGVARMLLAAVAALARRTGREHLWLTASLDNAAADALYRGLFDVHEDVRAHALTLTAFDALSDAGEQYWRPEIDDD